MGGDEECRRMRSRNEQMEIFAESEEDLKFGRKAPVQGTFDDLRCLLTGENPLNAKYYAPTQQTP